MPILGSESKFQMRVDGWNEIYKFGTGCNAVKGARQRTLMRKAIAFQFGVVGVGWCVCVQVRPGCSTHL